MVSDPCNAVRFQPARTAHGLQQGYGSHREGTGMRNAPVTEPEPRWLPVSTAAAQPLALLPQGGCYSNHIRTDHLADVDTVQQLPQTAPRKTVAEKMTAASVPAPGAIDLLANRKRTRSSPGSPNVSMGGAAPEVRPGPGFVSCYPSLVQHAARKPSGSTTPLLCSLPHAGG
jgi:hypothetical protein